MGSLQTENYKLTYWEILRVVNIGSGQTEWSTHGAVMQGVVNAMRDQYREWLTVVNQESGQ